MSDNISPFHHKPAQDEGGIESWLMSYADMITLLLCFFIIFVSTSEPKMDRLAAATKGLQQRFGSLSLTTPFEGAFKTLVGTVESSSAQQYIAVEQTENGLKVELSAVHLFGENSAEIDPSQQALVEDILKTLKDESLSTYRIDIEGYADAEGGSGTAFTSAWELSTARATRLVRLFTEAGVTPKRLRAIGYGDTRPLAPSKDASGDIIPENQERNRRVVIRVER